jgi:hypothetical protein
LTATYSDFAIGIGQHVGQESNKSIAYMQLETYDALQHNGHCFGVTRGIGTARAIGRVAVLENKTKNRGARSDAATRILI